MTADIPGQIRRPASRPPLPDDAGPDAAQATPGGRWSCLTCRVIPLGNRPKPTTGDHRRTSVGSRRAIDVALKRLPLGRRRVPLSDPPRPGDHRSGPSWCGDARWGSPNRGRNTTAWPDALSLLRAAHHDPPPWRTPWPSAARTLRAGPATPTPVAVQDTRGRHRVPRCQTPYRRPGEGGTIDDIARRNTVKARPGSPSTWQRKTTAAPGTPGPTTAACVEHARIPTASDAVAWGRSRTPRVRIRTADIRMSRAGTAPRPEGFSHTWTDSDTTNADNPSTTPNCPRASDRRTGQ